MAKQSGSWYLETTVEPNECDLEHIAEMIKQGYTNGEIVQDEEDEKKESEDCYEIGDEFSTNSIVHLSDSTVPENTTFEIIEALEDGEYKVHFHHCLFDDYFKSMGCKDEDGTVVCLYYGEIKNILS